MKFFLFLLIGMFSYTIVLADEYVPLLSKESQWNVIEQRIERETNVLQTFYQTVYKLSKDTLINDLTYSELIYSTDSLKTWDRAGFLREDIKSKKVYFYTNEEEVLLYDFSLKVGDVIIHPESGENAVIEKIEYIEVGGALRKALKYDYGYDSWIEGIGSDRYGLLLNPKSHDEEYSYYYYTALVIDEKLMYVENFLLHFFVDFWGVLDPPDYLPIEGGTSNNIVPQKKDIHLFVNSNMLTIQSPVPYEVTIYNFSGDLVKSSKKAESHSLFLSKGLYIIVVGSYSYKIKV